LRCPAQLLRFPAWAARAVLPSIQPYLLGLIPVSLVAVMTQAQCAAEFAAEAAALGGIAWVTLVVSDLLALVAYVFVLPVTPVVSDLLALVAYVFILPVTPVVSDLLALVAYVFILRGCRRPEVRRGSKLRRFGTRLRRFRGERWPSVRSTGLLFHACHATVTIHAAVTISVTQR
jgi:hypothetical protein